MKSAVTAIYRSYDVANQVRDALERVGLGRDWITVLPSTRIMPDTTDPSRSTAPAQENLHDAIDRLHDLHLPEADTRVYQQAIRNGDYVVSVSLDDDTDLTRIEEIMRRPEDAYDLDELETRYAGADYVPRRQPLGDDYDERMVGRRDDRRISPYMRSYRRDLPLVPAIALTPLGTR